MEGHQRKKEIECQRKKEFREIADLITCHRKINEASVTTSELIKYIKSSMQQDKSVIFDRDTYLLNYFGTIGVVSHREYFNYDQLIEKEAKLPFNKLINFLRTSVSENALLICGNCFLLTTTRKKILDFTGHKHYCLNCFNKCDHIKLSCCEIYVISINCAHTNVFGSDKLYCRSCADTKLIYHFDLDALKAVLPCSTKIPFEIINENIYRHSIGKEAFKMVDKETFLSKQQKFDKLFRAANSRFTHRSRKIVCEAFKDSSFKQAYKYHYFEREAGFASEESVIKSCILLFCFFKKIRHLVPRFVAAQIVHHFLN